MSIDASRGQVVIGLDFGTTTSKGAYYSPRELKSSFGSQRVRSVAVQESEIYAVELSSSSHVERTQLAWHKTEGRFLYGSEVDRELNRESIMAEDVFILPKLSLDRSTQTLKLRQKQRAQRHKMPSKDGKPLSSIDLVAQFLHWFKDRLLESVKDRPGCGRLGDPAVADNVIWVLTLPANWEEASDDLRQAATQAGLRNVQLVTETEAAAAAMLGSPDVSDPDLAQENILVLDVGGGTHNVITYLVKADGTMQEGVPGTGGLSGSYWLNDQFQDLLKTERRYMMNDFLLGQGRDPNNDAHFQKLLDECTSEFENEKKRFNGFSADEHESKMVIPIRGIHDPTRTPESKSIILRKSESQPELWG
ncbi:MAG: hypothetical protein Q9168_004960 [Polycauliona sp. 1 TL-2023]